MSRWPVGRWLGHTDSQLICSPPILLCTFAFQLLMNLCYDKSAQSCIMFFSFFGALKLLLKQWLPVGDTLWVFKFLFSNKLHFLKQRTIFLRSFRPFALMTMIDIRLSWTIEWSSFVIFAITFTTWRSALNGTSSIAPEKSPLWGLSAIHRMARPLRSRSRMATG